MGGGCKTALLSPGLGLAVFPLMLRAVEAMPVYLARMAWRRARRSASVSSMGFSVCPISRSISGSGSFGAGGGGGERALLDTRVAVDRVGLRDELRLLDAEILQ